MFLYNYNPLRAAAVLSMVLILSVQSLYAQTKIGGTAGPGDASAVLELQSNNQGFLHPRMTTTQRDAINNPATGLTIYNTTVSCLQVYKGAANGGWFDFCSGAGALSFTNCNTPVIAGVINAQTPTTATVQLSYVNNTGQAYGTFSSNTVNGITLNAPGGTVTPIAAGSGSITLTASGTPAAAGATNIPVVLAGAACNIPITVGAFQGNVPVACGTAPGCTGGVDPTTAVAGDKICWGGFEYQVITAGGRLWLDRNLGARQRATTETDVAGFGDHYQWGRKGDGHQCTIYSNGGSSNGGSNPSSSTTATLATTADPGHSMFITSTSNWLTSLNNNLWTSNADGGTNNPCPPGWRVNTFDEITLVMPNGVPVAFASRLYLPLNGSRVESTGAFNNVNTFGLLWTTTISSANISIRYPGGGGGHAAATAPRAVGSPVRCIKH